MHFPLLHCRFPFFSLREDLLAAAKLRWAMWVAKQQIARSRRGRVWAGAFLCWAFLMLATPKIPYSPKNHAYADMRNFFGAGDGILLPFLSFLLPLCLHVLSRECAWRAFVVRCCLMDRAVLRCGCSAGVPNTLNVITNFPFLIVGVLGFVLCLQGSYFNVR